MRRLIHLLLVFGLFPTFGHAEVDCGVVGRIERINISIRILRDDPSGEHGPYNRALLVTDLKTLSTRAASKALSDHSDQYDINRLLSLVSKAQTAMSQVSGMSVSQFATSLQTDEWTTVLTDSTIALSRMPCGNSQGRLPGDAEGREIDGAIVERLPIKALELVVKKPIQTIVVTLLSIAAIVYGSRKSMTWSRNRKALLKRRSKRFTTIIPSHIALNGKVLEAAVLDLSCDGTKIRYWHADAVKADMEIGVFIDNKWRMGKLVWSNALYIGVQFDRSLPIPLVRRLARVHRPDDMDADSS